MRVNYHFLFFYFFVPNVLKIISRHLSFFNYRGGVAVILHGMASIFSNVLDILHVQHQFFKIIWVFLWEKYTCSKIGLVAQVKGGGQSQISLYIFIVF